MPPAARALFRLSLLTALSVGWPGYAWAVKTDTVILGNGDRITGEVKGLSQGKLDYSTDDAGRLSIEWERVARVRSPHLFEVELASGAKRFGWLEDSGRDGFAVVKGASDDTVLVAKVVAITPLNAGFLHRVKSYLDVGFTLAKANLATTFSLGGELDYRGPSMGFKFGFDSYAQGQESSSTTTRNTATLTVGYFLPKRWSAFALGGLEQNDELDLNLRATVGGGFQRVLRRSNRSDLSVAGGLVGTHEQFEVVGDSVVTTNDLSNLEGLLVVSWNAYRFDTPKLDFSNGLELYPSITEAGRVRGTFSFRLKYELFPDFNVGLKFSDTFDSRPPDEKISKNDYVTTLTIGWSYRR